MVYKFYDIKTKDTGVMSNDTLNEISRNKLHRPSDREF